MSDPDQPDSTDSSPPPPPTSADADALERRQFVRRMGKDAVGVAGSIFSLSRVLTRSATAAGQAVMNELEGLQPGGAADPAAEVAVVPAPEPVPVPVADVPWPAALPSAPVPVRPEVLLDADQIALLEAATSAVVAVNREGHAPALTTATVLWDGATVRFATLGWSRRTSMLRVDPRIGLLIEGPGDGRFVSVTGTAYIADGREARDALWPLLLREAGDGGEAVAQARWMELVAADADRAAIVITPDQVLSGRR